MVDDTAKAKTFYGALFGDGFHQIGPQDRWWSTRAAFGLFSNALGEAYPPRREPGDAPEVNVFVCVADLVAHRDRVMALGGRIFAESAMGPYQVCACEDDQGTRFSTLLARLRRAREGRAKRVTPARRCPFARRLGRPPSPGARRRC